MNHRSIRAHSAAVVAVSAIVASAFCLGTALPASADAPNAIVSISTPPIPGNPSLSPLYNMFADNGNATIGRASVTSGLMISGGNQLNGEPFSITILPAAGSSLTPGDYPIRYANHTSSVTTPTLPSMTVYYNNNGGTFVGDLDIRDLAWNSQGTITRFDITFKAPQGNGPSTSSGELRMGELENSSVDLSARNLAWNAPPVGYPTQVETEWLHNTGATAVPIGSATVIGDASRDYVLSANSCSGHSLGAGATCSLGIGYSPSTVGPRNATLSIAVGSGTQLIGLTGTTLLGTSSLTTSGNDELDQGTTHSFVAGSTYTLTSASLLSGFQWVTGAASGDDSHQIILKIAAGTDTDPLALGSHPTVTYTTQKGDQYGESTSVDGEGCGSSTGTVDVKSFAVDGFGQPSIANITYTQQCLSTSPVLTGTLLWQWRSDTTAPTTPTAVVVNGSGPQTVSWQASTSTDVSRTIVRLVAGSGANATPTSGYAVADGNVTSAVLPTVPANGQYTVVVFAVDSSGNVSAAATASFTSGSQVTPPSLPGAPANVSAVAGNGNATVSFSPPADTSGLPVTGYVLQSSVGTSVSGAASPLTLTGLTNGQAYQFRVQAITAAGQGAFSAWSNTITPQAPPTTTNLLPDPGFESGYGGWVQFNAGSLSRVSSPVHSGSSALRVTATSVTPTLVGVSQVTAVVNSVAGRVYTFSCWVDPSSAGLSVTARLLEYTQTFHNVIHLPSSSRSNLPAGVWTRMSVTGTAVNSGERIIPQLYATNETTATGTVNYDDCSLSIG